MTSFLDKYLACMSDTPLCFYPSAGKDFGLLQSLNQTHFVLCDYGFSKNSPYKKIFPNYRELRIGKDRLFPIQRDETGVLFQGDDCVLLYYFEDNNIVLDKLISNQTTLSCFIGKADGCQEGGNYECVNDHPFFIKLLPLMNDRCLYITDHIIDGFYQRYVESGFWTNNIPARVDRIKAVWEDEAPRWLFNSRHYSVRRLTESPYESSRIAVLLIKRKKPRIRQATIGRITLSIEEDSIISPLVQTDGFFGTRRIINKRLWLGNTRRQCCHIQHMSTQETYSYTQRILKKAKEKHWSTIASLPFGNGEHHGLIDALHEWGQETQHAEVHHPTHIRIFHIDKNDFDDLSPLFE